MLSIFFAALTGWLAVLELVADLLGWRGLRWGGPALRSLTLATAWRSLRALWQRGTGAGIGALLLLLPPALVLQGGLACLRNWQLDPRRRLRPGNYADRQIIRIDLPTALGPVPALYIAPHTHTDMAVCYVHGSGCDKVFYTWELADAFVERNMALLLIDLDGHGESPRPQAFPDLLHGVRGAVGWLRERYQRVGVMGLSLGGCVAARAVAEGMTVDALVIVEAPVYLHMESHHYRQETLLVFQPAVLRQLQYGSPCHLIRTWTDTPRIRGVIGTQPLIAALDLPGSLHHLAERPPDTPPLLLVYGGRDAIARPDQAAQVRQVQPAWAAFHIFPSSSHLSLAIDPRMFKLTGDWLVSHLRKA